MNYDDGDELCAGVEHQDLDMSVAIMMNLTHTWKIIKQNAMRGQAMCYSDFTVGKAVMWSGGKISVMHGLKWLTAL